VRLAFQPIAHRVSRIVLHVGRSLESCGSTRQCTVEVHMADGRVERIEERQRRLGPLLRRAIHRAWEIAAVRAGHARAPVAPDAAPAERRRSTR
jgi:hypothetical protein